LQRCEPVPFPDPFGGTSNATYETISHHRDSLRVLFWLRGTGEEAGSPRYRHVVFRCGLRRGGPRHRLPRSRSAKSRSRARVTLDLQPPQSPSAASIFPGRCNTRPEPETPASACCAQPGVRFCPLARKNRPLRNVPAPSQLQSATLLSQGVGSGVGPHQSSIREKLDSKQIGALGHGSKLILHGCVTYKNVVGPANQPLVGLTEFCSIF